MPFRLLCLCRIRRASSCGRKPTRGPYSCVTLSVRTRTSVNAPRGDKLKLSLIFWLLSCEQAPRLFVVLASKTTLLLQDRSSSLYYLMLSRCFCELSEEDGCALDSESLYLYPCPRFAGRSRLVSCCGWHWNATSTTIASFVGSTFSHSINIRILRGIDLYIISPKIRTATAVVSMDLHVTQVHVVYDNM